MQPGLDNPPEQPDAENKSRTGYYKLASSAKSYLLLLSLCTHWALSQEAVFWQSTERMPQGHPSILISNGTYNLIPPKHSYNASLSVFYGAFQHANAVRYSVSQFWDALKIKALLPRKQEKKVLSVVLRRTGPNNPCCPSVCIPVLTLQSRVSTDPRTAVSLFSLTSLPKGSAPAIFKIII